MDSYTRIDVPEEIKELDRYYIQLDSARQEIAKYDYIGIKIAMGVATTEEYSEQIEYTESIRQVIREIQEDIDNYKES